MKETSPLPCPIKRTNTCFNRTMQTSLNRALNKHVVSSPHLGTLVALPLAKFFVPCTSHLPVSTDLKGHDLRPGVEDKVFGRDQACRKVLPCSQQLFESLYTATACRRVEHRESRHHVYTEAANSGQDPHMLKDPRSKVLIHGASGEGLGFRLGQSISQGF